MCVCVCVCVRACVCVRVCVCVCVCVGKVSRNSLFFLDYTKECSEPGGNGTSYASTTAE